MSAGAQVLTILPVA